MKKIVIKNTIKEGFINCSAKKKVALQAVLVELDKIAPTDDTEVDNTFYQNVLSVLRQPEV